MSGERTEFLFKHFQYAVPSYSENLTDVRHLPFIVCVCDQGLTEPCGVLPGLSVTSWCTEVSLISQLGLDRQRPTSRADASSQLPLSGKSLTQELDKKGEVEPDKSKSSSNSAHISPFNTPNQQVNDPFDANAVPSVIATVQDPLPANRPGTGPGTAPSGSTGLQRDLERALIGSLTSSYKFKRGGLVKKTISNGNLHLM